MIATWTDPAVVRVERALATLEARSVRLAPGRWLLDGSIVLSCEQDRDAWLVLEGPGGCARSEGAWSLAECNIGLGWPAKLTLGAGARGVVRADIAIADANGDLSEKVRRSWHAVRQGCESLARGDGRRGCDAEDTGASPAVDASASGLISICEACGWTFHARDDGRILVDLDVAGGFFQAEVVAHPSGFTRASLELVRVEALHADCREAIGLVLLTIAGLVRAVRPAASIDSDGRTSAGLETRIEGPVSRAALDRAFACLSLAASLCAREVDALQNPRQAALYLSLQRGWSPGTSGHEATRTISDEPESKLHAPHVPNGGTS